jgi:hypothetical protein
MRWKALVFVMPGLVPVSPPERPSESEKWMAGTSPVMTQTGVERGFRFALTDPK